MEIAIGITVYLVLLAGLLLFGRFLHECDEILEEQFNAKNTGAKGEQKG